ncbi:hypothetical protein [Promicromonospora sp. NPDC050880]|uniref:hypothetical protein n=1 Tax=Promicromonospora sp. NPDC050880 TaxID=3364406 RepID=UPI00378E387C
MPERTTRAPGAVGRARTAGFVPALVPGWRWACYVCPPTPHHNPTEPTREAAHARLAAHQLAAHQDHVIAALAARAARKEAA